MCASASSSLPSCLSSRAISVLAVKSYGFTFNSSLNCWVARSGFPAAFSACPYSVCAHGIFGFSSTARAKWPAAATKSLRSNSVWPSRNADSADSPSRRMRSSRTCAVELNPKMPWAHTLYGQALKAAGKPEQATAQFNEELKVNPYDFTANTEIALLLRQDGKLDEALAHITLALQVRPNDPGALYQRASIHLSQGLNQQARQELEQLIRDYPSFSEAHAALATVYYRLKRTADGDKETVEARRVREEAQKVLEEKRKPASSEKQ